ncbi:fer-1-like protein 5 isoform X3 [Hemicordylus capensis]|uniref:fer-1-like protein 5 isoform X3 n=1 Tax=Hemicordylus capensis TaxID=884348 RepID=UPI002304C6D8|nr:fer-1-like protein 5 isoform X3 [Hemicordylus capensis]
MLRVVVLSAHIAPESADRPDTCVVANFRDFERRTRVVQKEQDPIWNETLVWYLDAQPLDSSSYVTVELLDWISQGERSFGAASFSLASVAERPKVFITIKDQALRDSSLEATGNTITLKIAFTPFEVKPIQQPKKFECSKFVCCPVHAKDSEQEELVPRDRIGAGEIPLPTPKRDLGNKKQVFQVRVGIIECRQLQENNVKPVVKVSIADHVFRTRIRFGNNPFYDETFVQNFNEIPSQLFEEYITIQVMNSKALRADSLIGVFKIEIGLVYESPGHALIAKWLTLYHPTQLHTGLRGYVKVNLCVLGAGDRAPDAEKVAATEELENNILKSAVMPAARMITLQIYIYRAEDMPQMSEGIAYFRTLPEDLFGDYVDPSVEVNFAGRSLRTKVVYGDANPHWNQLMSFPMQLPSMCDLVKFTVLDGDQYGTSDILGTAFLSLSQISYTGAKVSDLSGFLPCFGPTFLTIYGSPSEFVSQGDPFAKQRLGSDDGVDYRGRILVEVNTNKEAIPNQTVESIPDEMVKRIERYLPRHQYGLCAVFYSATMLTNTKELIQFEVSIGNYGNTLDETCKPLPSTTQYSHAVYDGHRYYYLPWYDTKPMVAVSSFWEDVTYRIACFNTLQVVHGRLKRNLDALKAIRVATGPTTDVAWNRLQKELTEDCKKSFPALDMHTATVLDQQMQKLRTQLLQKIARAAISLRSTDPLQKLIAKAENWLNLIASIIPETQISLPDVVIWMLCDDTRVAYARVKPHKIMFSKAGPYAKGRLCGKTQTIFLKGAQSKGGYTPIPALLRVRMWLGRLADSAEWMKCCEGNIVVYAETYENQRKMHGIWGTKDLMDHPNFSDVTGQVSLPKDQFRLPNGWKWDGDWTVEPQRRLLLDTETNHTEVLEEVYENQIRKPGRTWKLATIPYSDMRGAPALAKGEMVCPSGWNVVEDWKVELNRAVDDAGWEYGVVIPPAEMPRAWIAAEKTYHTHRRRRWFRKRCRNLDSASREELMSTFLKLHSKKKADEEEVWEYASLYGWKFHLERRPNDVIRRRCWRRKLAPSVPSRVVPIFLLEGSLGMELQGLEKIKQRLTVKKQEEKVVEQTPSQNLLKMNTPLLFCVFKHPVYYQLRCYIYQARDLVGSGTKGSADPVAHVSFLHMSQCTKAISGTLHPCWDETLLFENILIYGDPRGTEQNPPVVALEFFDGPAGGHSEFFMGRTLCSPTVCLDLSQRRLPRLYRHAILREQAEAGHLLAAFELLLDKKILAWGLRNMKNYNLLAISSPNLQIECGGDYIQTPPIKNLQENPNFLINVYLMKVYLPIDDDYAPPIELKVVDHREFGYKPVVGQATIRAVSQYFCDPWEEGKSHNLPTRAISKLKMKERLSKVIQKPWWWRVPKPQKKAKEKAEEEEEEEQVDWWSKYYVATGDLAKSGGHYLERGFDSVKVYSCELEEVPEFHGLQDFCQTFRLYRGKVVDESFEDPMVGGEFKGLFRIYPLPENPNVPPPPRQFQGLPENVAQLCLVRIYIIRAFNLQPKDRNGLCDPYIKIKLGKKKIGDREEYIPNTLQPIFGRTYELSCSIPVEKDLKISLFDFDIFPPDDLIGDTIIDLENRLMSHYGANCGLPQTYCVSGPSQWRDQVPPTELLANYAFLKNMPPPEISDNGSKAVFLGKAYQLSNLEPKMPSHGLLGPAKERMALHILHTCRLVPEHIETRTLYSSIQPGIEQGKVQMWVDVFPESLGEPGPPFDITPRNPKRYELRCIIWNTKDVDLEDTNIFGDRMSDIYVKGWLEGLEEEKQKTDIHYRSLTGDGNFNWRFIFTMDYMPMEQICILTKKQHFWSLDETMHKVPPKLIIQIWDNDKFSADDFLGILELNLTSMPPPAKRPQQCTVKMLLEDHGRASPSSPFRHRKQKRTSLFVQKNMRGWWPCIVWEDDKPRVSGKVEMTLELLTDKEAEERPAGKGRDEPNMNPFLKVPERPETSFLWFTAPLKSLRFVIWQKSKWKILIFFCIVLLFFLFCAFIYSAPGYLAMKLINPMKEIHFNRRPRKRKHKAKKKHT